ncbi:hypothetical protein Misp01_71340 [Microtetraspora sp. NBRC 13810]|nr:hypothetical protein Misp01_71340 [Microtetraspora sp. NBRC 13810]
MLLWQEQKFKLMILHARADEFEDLFSKIMRLANGTSFHLARPGGTYGDAKCDGWDSTTKTLYSVYAPFSKKRRSDIRAKILSDFRGARTKWPEMQRWRLVHNDFFGMSAEITRELELLRSDPISQGVEILSDWDPQELWRILRSLPEGDRSELLGVPGITFLQGNDQWDSYAVRNHDTVDPAVLRATLRSLAQLCDNYQHDAILDPLCASAMARALTTWWLDDREVFGSYVEFLMERCEAEPMEASLTSLVFVMSCIQIGARRLGISEDYFIEMFLLNDVDAPPGVKVIAEIARDELAGKNLGIFVDDLEVRKKFVNSCWLTVMHIIGGLSGLMSTPEIFILQDLLVSTQRIQYLSPASDRPAE